MYNKFLLKTFINVSQKRDEERGGEGGKRKEGKGRGEEGEERNTNIKHSLTNRV